MQSRSIVSRPSTALRAPRCHARPRRLPLPSRASGAPPSQPSLAPASHHRPPTTAAQPRTAAQEANQQQQPGGGAAPAQGPPQAVVVGAGPAGATAAMVLSRAGFQVDVVERRGHPAAMAADDRRTYLIGLGERGLASLDLLGLSLGPDVGRRMQGSVYAYKSGKRVDDPFTPDTRIIGVDRQGLTTFLVQQAMAMGASGGAEGPQAQAAAAAAGGGGGGSGGSPAAPRAEAPAPGAATTGSAAGGGGAITFHFDALPQLDFAARRVVVSSKNRDTPPLELPYDLLVGADGAGSAVRTALADEGWLQVSRLSSPVAAMEYKAFLGLPHNPAMEALLPAAARGPRAWGMVFFALNNPQPGNPSPGSITLYQQPSGAWAGTMYLPAGTYDALAGAADHEGTIRQFTPPGFPEEWVPAMAQQMAGTRPSRISPMYRVSRLAVPQLGVVLLGDAGHSVTPQMGQGCNSALEDSALLGTCLQAGGQLAAAPACRDQLATALAAYDATRAPQVHALQRMEEESAWVRRPPQPTRDPLGMTLARVSWISFFLLLPLLRLLPGMRRRVHASLFQNIMATTLPYDRLYAAVRWAPLAWAALLAAVVAAARAAAGWLAAAAARVAA